MAKRGHPPVSSTTRETSKDADTFSDNPPSPASPSLAPQSDSPSNLRLGLLAATFFICMVIMELALEAASTQFSDLDSLTSAVTLFQFGFCVTLPAVVEGRKVLNKFPKTPSQVAPYARLAFAVVGATALATHSLHWVSYPTKVVFKSTKLIPTMLISTIVNPHTSKFGPLDYLSALLLCAGAAGYSWSGDKGGTSTSSLGIALLATSICCDAIVPNMQQKLMQAPSSSPGAYSALPTTMNAEGDKVVTAHVVARPPSSFCARFAGGTSDGGGLGLTAAELMVNTNAVVVIGVLAYCIVSGSLFSAIKTSMTSPVLLLYLTLIGMGLSTAVLAYTHLIKSAGSVVAVAVGTLRKVATVVLSYLIFPKALLRAHVFSGLLVLAGILLNSYSRQRRSSR